MEDVEFETTPLGMDEKPDQSDQEKEFLNNLHNLMLQLSESCRTEFESALQTQDMNQLSEPCKAELATAAQKTQGFEKAQEQAAHEAAAEMLSHNVDTNTIYYIFAFMILCVALVAGYVIWINNKLKEAGYYDKSSKKAPSKKRLAKERMKNKQQ